MTSASVSGEANPGRTAPWGFSPIFNEFDGEVVHGCLISGMIRGRGEFRRLKRPPPFFRQERPQSRSSNFNGKSRLAAPIPNPRDSDGPRNRREEAS